MPPLRASWKTQLAPLLKDKSEEEALNFLLAMVQFGLAYQTDQEQFGQEKPLTSDETLFYPYADCEDRAILFAWLVRDLLGLPVVGLDYPGHMATAVRLSQPIKGNYCLYQNAQYWVCDPTYLGAVAGQAMPDLAAINPEIVPLSEL
ncbi:MAG: hypothetical protein HC913_20120 [Microscillaceae bacterium]|nr:hypothetical protein [Microscillaceae bacterium]